MGERIPGGGGITHERLAQAGKQQGSPHALCTGCNSRARACTSPARGEAAFERLAGRAVDQRQVGESRTNTFGCSPMPSSALLTAAAAPKKNCAADPIDHGASLKPHVDRSGTDSKRRPTRVHRGPATCNSRCQPGSITPLAFARRDGGTGTPSARAVLRLLAISNLPERNGQVARLSPLRMQTEQSPT
jgi:hypothetical protein